MSGMRIGMDMSMRPELRMVLAPRMIQSMEILQLPIMDLQAKIQKELQENPFLELKEKHGRGGLTPSRSPSSTRTRRSSTTRPATWSSAGWRSSTATGTTTSTRSTGPAGASLDEEGDRKLDAMANMPRPAAVAARTTSPSSSATSNSTPNERRLARHICQLHRPHRLPRRPRAASDDDDRTRSAPVTLDEIAAAYDRARRPLERGGGRARPRGAEARPAPASAPATSRSACCCRCTRRDAATRDAGPGADPRPPGGRGVQPHPGHPEGDAVRPSPTIQEAIEELHHLDPKPGAKFADTGTQYVMPDVDGGADRRRRLRHPPDRRLGAEHPHQQARTSSCTRTRATTRRRRRVPASRSCSRPSGWWSAIEQRRNTLLKVTQGDHQPPAGVPRLRPGAHPAAEDAADRRPGEASTSPP